jgi:hypothetical protein
MNAISPEHMHELAGPHNPAALPFNGFAAPYDSRTSEDASTLLDLAGNQQNKHANINAGQRRVEGAQERHPEKETQQAETHGHSGHDYLKLVASNERPESHDRSHQGADRVTQGGDVVFTPSNCAFFAALFLLSFSVVLRWNYIMGLLASLLF